MEVSELIEKLKEYPMEQEVVIRDDENEWREDFDFDMETYKGLLLL